jgi:hypothetical protein
MRVPANRCPDADDLLRDVHSRLGGVGVDLMTFGATDQVEARWRRSYDGILSDERFAQAVSIADVLRAILLCEDAADAAEATDD